MNKENRLTKRMENIMASDNNVKLYPNFPNKNLLIEVTNMCNNICIFCGNRKMCRKKGFIKDEVVESALKQAFELGMREVGFYSTGEPLLNKNIFNYIKLAKSIGYSYTYITTNGLLLDEDVFKKLIESGLDSIKLSINAIDRKKYFFIHGVDKYDVVLSNLKKICKIKQTKNLKIKIFVSYIATKYTDEEKKKILDKFSCCDEVVIVNVRNQSGMVPEVNKYLKCSKECGKIESQRPLPCFYPFKSINVTYEGYLTACCSDFENALVYGDLSKETMKDAWQNIYITSLRKKHLNNELNGTLCNNCIYNCESTPVPIRKDINFKIADINDDTEVKNRIKKYLKEGMK